MTNRAQELIKSFYEEEAQLKESEITYTDYSVRLNASDISMLEVIAKRFGKSADRIASEAVSSAIYSMVEAIDAGERKNIAKEADELNESLSKKAAKANGNSDFAEKSVTWVMNDRAITREENKRKKDSPIDTTQDMSSTHISSDSNELEASVNDIDLESDDVQTSVFAS